MYRGHVDLPRMAAISSPLALPRTAQGRRLRSCRPFWGPVVCPSRLAPLRASQNVHSRGGVSFFWKTRDRLSKKRLIRAQQVLTNLKVAGYTPFETEGVIERAAPGVRQPCRHGDHHSARQTGCVQPTLTPPTERRRTVAEQPSGAPSGGGRSRAFRRRSAACDDGRGAGIATCTTRKPHSTMFSDRLLRSVLCPLHGLEVVARDARLLLLRGR